MSRPSAAPAPFPQSNRRWWQQKKPEDFTNYTIDLMAAFALLDSSLNRRETSVMLDILHGSFPELNHSVLKKRVTRALAAPKPIPLLGKALKHSLPEDKRCALALQIFVLASAGDSNEERKHRAFTELCDTLDIPDLPNALELEMAGLPADDLPFQRVTFGHPNEGFADVTLPKESQNQSFTVYRSASDIWVRNTGKMPLLGRGHTLSRGEFVRIIEQQDISLPDWRLSHEDLIFFLDAQNGGSPRVLFLGDDDGELIIGRSRSRLHSVKIELGTDAIVTRLDRAVIQLQPPLSLKEKEPAAISYHSRLKIGDSPAISLEKLRRDSQLAGDQFALTQDTRTVLVGNVGAELGPEDLYITPGLAPPAIIRITSHPDSGSGTLEIVKSSAPISLNYEEVRTEMPLKDGDLISFSRQQAVRCRFTEGIINEERTIIRGLQLRDLGHSFRSGVTAFESLNFSLQRGEMMAIIGPSGCGKSSLLKALAGHLKPSRGAVIINGKSLYEQRERFLPFISQMGQEESLSPNLTVREHLRHAFTIHRPHLPPLELARRVDSVLNTLDLQRLARRRVGEPGDKSLSGGERGRLDLGLDLGSSAEIFLFDEPTSGLSSKDSEYLAQTLRSLALDKMVVCSLHRPGASVLELFDKVLLLDTGGKMAFFGTPAELVRYFEEAAEELGLPISSSGTEAHTADFVFDVLESPLLTSGVAMRSSSRRFPATFWQERFESRTLLDEFNQSSSAPQHTELSQPGTSSDLPRRRRLGLREKTALLRVHAERAFLSKFRSPGTIWSIMAETPLLALLIGQTLRASPGTGYRFETALHIPIFLFLTVTVGMFLGLTNSATEILRDAPQLRRERNVRRGMQNYVLAKFVTLTLLASLQCAVFLLISHWQLEFSGMFWKHWVFMTVTACTGTAMALTISAMVRSERAALNAVPLLLVPQILLAGALVPFGEMNRGLFQGGGRARDHGAEPVPARIVPLRYAFEGLMVTQATQNEFEALRQEIQNELEDLKKHSKPTAWQETRFDVLKLALMRLSVIEATNSQSASDHISTIRRLVRKNQLSDLEVLSPYVTPSSEDAKPAADFFLNERVDKLFSQAEAKRQDYRKSSEKNQVFLARQKQWFGISVNTGIASLTILIFLTTLLLAFTSRLTHKRYIEKIS